MAAQKDLFLLHSSVLLGRDSTANAESTALRFFHGIFKDTKPPAYFNYDLITVFFEVSRDLQRAMGVRIEAVSTVINLLSGRQSLRHFILDKGALSLFVHCLVTADNRMRDECLRGLHRAFICCNECTKSMRDTPETVCKAIGYAMQFFIDDIKVIENALFTLEILNRSGYDRKMFIPKIPGLISNLLGIISSGIKRIAKPATYLLCQLISDSHSNDDIKQMITCDGFLLKIGAFLSDEKTRFSAIQFFWRVARGPPDLIDLLVIGEAPITQLMHGIRSWKRDRLEAFGVLCNMMESLINTPSPKILTSFLGYGVIGCIVDYAVENCRPYQNFDRVREVIQTVLILHPEWWPVVKKAGGVQWLRVNPPKIRDISADYVMLDEDATFL